jgi:hypothetical protein
MREFPVTNSFSHSEPILGAVRLAGLRADARGLTIDPAFPFADFEWSSRAFAVSYAPTEARGQVTALGDETIELRVRVPGGVDATSNVAVQVNDGAVAFELEDGIARFALPVRRGASASWSVRTNP